MLQYKPWSQDVLDLLTNQACYNGFSCLDLELGGECPYRCIYCETPYRRQKSLINIHKVCSLISSGQFKWVYICGIGEPTFGANQDALLQILSCCKQYGAKCSIFSNLSNLSDELINYIRDGVLHILFKFDTQDKELIQQLYHPDDLDQHLLNIHKIVDLVCFNEKTTNIAASIVPTQENKDEIPYLVDWCIKKNIYPLVAQLEYAGAAKDVFERLALSDDQLRELKAKIEDVIGEEYHVPFCPSLVAGICITYNNEITIDHKTGLSCHSFWLEDPKRDVVCNDLSDDLSFEEISQKLVDARAERFKDFKNHLKEYCKNIDVFGGCGGNKLDVFRFYISSMDKATNYKGDNLKISRSVYLDNNATTKVSEPVRTVMLPFFNTKFANPNSKYGIGSSVRVEINNARETIADAIKCKSENLTFTSSGSEANSLAIHSLLSNNPQKRTIISTEIEHDSILQYLEHLKDKGYTIYNIPVNHDGEIDMNFLSENPPNWDDVCFASVMYVNNETGVINNIKKLSGILHERNIPIHCDAVQAFGKLLIDVNDLGVDYLSISGHKIHAPKGIGALYANECCQLHPIIFGNQESARRGGTENAAYIVGFGKATSTIYSQEHFLENSQRMQDYRDSMEKEIEARLHDVVQVVINGKFASRVPNTSNIGFIGRDAFKLSLALEQRGICVSNGAACHNGDPIFSPVLIAMKSPLVGFGALRVSLSDETKERDIEYFVDNLVNIIKNQRGGLKDVRIY